MLRTEITCDECWKRLWAIYVVVSFINTEPSTVFGLSNRDLPPTDFHVCNVNCWSSWASNPSQWPTVPSSPATPERPARTTPSVSDTSSSPR